MQADEVRQSTAYTGTVGAYCITIPGNAHACGALRTLNVDGSHNCISPEPRREPHACSVAWNTQHICAHAR